jgi:hypothetical protein
MTVEHVKPWWYEWVPGKFARRTVNRMARHRAKQKIKHGRWDDIGPQKGTQSLRTR